MPGGNSEWEPPDSISNSEVKRLSADDSVGPPHVKVGHRQALNYETLIVKKLSGFFFAFLLHNATCCGLTTAITQRYMLRLDHSNYTTLRAAA